LEPFGFNNRRTQAMQMWGNIGSVPLRKLSKGGKVYYETRVAESQAGVDASPTWYTVRIMSEKDPGLKLGDFVRVTGKLKADFYLSRTGEPTGTLLVIAFEATKKTKTLNSEQPAPEPTAATKTEPKPQAIQHASAHAWSD
jgi:hypothetical protein